MIFLKSIVCGGEIFQDNSSTMSSLSCNCNDLVQLTHDLALPDYSGSRNFFTCVLSYPIVDPRTPVKGDTNLI